MLTRKFFAEYQDFNAVMFVDDMNRALILDETEVDYGARLTINLASFFDFSNMDMTGTAEEARCSLGGLGAVLYFPGDLENIGADRVTEITTLSMIIDALLQTPTIAVAIKNGDYTVQAAKAEFGSQIIDNDTKNGIDHLKDIPQEVRESIRNYQMRNDV